MPLTEPCKVGLPHNAESEIVLSSLPWQSLVAAQNDTIALLLGVLENRNSADAVSPPLDDLPKKGDVARMMQELVKQVSANFQEEHARMRQEIDTLQSNLAECQRVLLDEENVIRDLDKEMSRNRIMSAESNGDQATRNRRVDNEEDGSGPVYDLRWRRINRFGTLCVEKYPLEHPSDEPWHYWYVLQELVLPHPDMPQAIADWLKTVEFEDVALASTQCGSELAAH